MAAKAFVLIETAVGKNKEVVDGIKKIKGVKTLDTVTGPYDVIVVVESETLSDIGDIVIRQIHPIPGISRTVTCLSVKSD